MSKIWDYLIITGVIFFSSALLWTFAGLGVIYQNFDGPYYLVVAKSWYDPQIIAHNFSFPLPLEYYPAHFPFYPLIIRLVDLVLNAPFVSMVAVNVAASMATAVLIYEVWKKMGWGNPLVAALVWAFMWPRMWAVRSVGSPETLFIGLVVASLFCFSKQKYFWAGLLGGLATITKSPGILLLISYGLWGLIRWVKDKKIEWRVWPVSVIGIFLLGLFWFYGIRAGDFWAYFNSGDNIHLQLLPFKIFDSSQAWVGSFWLEDVIWIYLIAGIGIFRALKKNLVWGIFGAVFYTTILFVSHRDISRYSLPLVPVVMLGFSEVLERKGVRWGLALLVIPMFFYTLNFVMNNMAGIPNWGAFGFSR